MNEVLVVRIVCKITVRKIYPVAIIFPIFDCLYRPTCRLLKISVGIIRIIIGVQRCGWGWGWFA